MAKFKLRTEFIAGLEAAGFIKNNLMKVRVTYRQYRITGESRYEIEFNKNAVLETNNEFAITSLLGQKPPAIKKNGQWIVGNPALSLFVEVPENDLTATKVIHTDGVEVVTAKEHKALAEYADRTKVTLPKSLKKSDMTAYLLAASLPG